MHSGSADRLRWFASVARWGLTQETFTQMSHLDLSLDAVPESFDADALGADHYDALLLNTFPHEGFYRNTSGLVGDQPPEIFLSLLASGDIGASEPWDHLGVQLDLLATCGKDVVERQLLGQHLLPWLPPFVLSLRFGPSAFYASFGAALWNELMQISAQLGVEARPIKPTADAVPLHDETSVGDLAERFLTPAQSGWVLTRHDLDQLARSHDLHHGFGSRSLMLANLFQAAGKFEQFPGLMETMIDLARYWEQAYASLRADNGEVESFVTPWLHRLHQTQRELNELKTQAQVGESTP